MRAVAVGQGVAAARELERPSVCAVRRAGPYYLLDTNIVRPGSELGPTKRSLAETKKTMSVRNDVRSALLCVWNCFFGGIALVMGLVATAGMGIEMVGITVKRAATVVGLTACEYQVDAEKHEEVVCGGMR